MPPRRSKEPEKKLKIVKAVKDMIQLDLRQHIQRRHPGLGFWTKNEHNQDHRIRGDEALDHTHAPSEAEKAEMEAQEETPREEEASDAKDEG